MTTRHCRDREASLRRLLRDVRSGQVVFLSHCLLNQNTRYPGGAICPGVVVDAIKPYMEAGVGIVQMPCPEQQLWGGVLKRRFLALLGRPYLARAARLLLGPGRRYLQLRYRFLARAVARHLEDYLRSGYEVVGVVGVAGSPSCGAKTTLDLSASLRALGSCPGVVPTREWITREVVDGAIRTGRGLFIEALTDQLTRRGCAVATTEYTLPSPGTALAGEVLR